jgi:hypothetical protein
MPAASANVAQGQRCSLNTNAHFAAAAARKLLIDRPGTTYYVTKLWFVLTQKRDMDLKESRRVWTLTDKRATILAGQLAIFLGVQARGFLHRRVKVTMNYGF